MTTTDYVPGLAGIPAAESAISFVDGIRGVLEYRGIPITELAEKSSFEETTLLLLDGKLPNAERLESFRTRLTDACRLDPEVETLLRQLPRDGHPMNALQTAIGALGMSYPGRDVADESVRIETTNRLLGAVPAITAAFHRIRQGDDPVAPKPGLSHAAQFFYQLRGTMPGELETRVLDNALILHADHTMNASTFTARVIASTLADGYSVVAGAVGSLSGPLHGGANEAVLAMLDTMPTVADVRSQVGDMISRKEKIMGVGHRVYKVKDPRAHILQSLGETLFKELGASPYYERAKELEAVVAEGLGAKGIYPNVDFYSGIVYDKLDIPRDLFTPIFAISRVAGWCAHWMEQLEDNRIFRPRQVYRGEHDQPYVPMDERN